MSKLYNKELGEYVDEKRHTLEFSKKYVPPANMKTIFYGILEGDEKIEIWCSPEVPAALTYYDHKRKTHVIFIGTRLYKFNHKNNEEELKDLVFVLLTHELGHILYTERNLKKINAQLQKENISFELFNLFEDARIENLIRKQISDNIRQPFYFQSERWVKLPDEVPDMSPEAIFFLMLRTDNRRPVNALHYNNVKKFYEKVLKATNAEEVISIMVDWVNFFYPNRPKQQQQNQQGQGQQGQGQGQGQQGQGQGQGQQGQGQDPFSDIIDAMERGTFKKPRIDEDFTDNSNDGNNNNGLADMDKEEEEENYYDAEEESLLSKRGKKLKTHKTKEEEEEEGSNGQDMLPELNEDFIDDFTKKNFKDLGESVYGSEGLSKAELQEMENTIAELKINAIPISGASAQETQRGTSEKPTMSNNHGIHTLDSYSNTKEIFNEHNKAMMVDIYAAKQIEKIFKKIKEEVNTKIRHKKMGGSISQSRIPRLVSNPGKTSAYRRREEDKRFLKNMKIAVVLDTSASMRGYPEMAQRLILYGLNRMAKNISGIEVDVIASYAGSMRSVVYQTIRLPASDKSLLSVRAQGGSGITPALVANKELLIEKDIVLFVTDGLLGDSREISKENVAKFFGRNTVSIGYYPGFGDNNIKNKGYNKEMESWFDRLFVGSDVPGMMEQIVEFINEIRTDPRKMKAIKSATHKDGNIVVEKNIGEKVHKRKGESNRRRR